ncbi:hypothetical protein EDD37DRAFT_623510 [Exophiala viscosa]|uniref:uncharacterized protein n=1 Tax=Exophiala viscosa TaxID=2486360 RepID=UPI00219A6011|nr:hypothetical protein EDD37DRAFT_623510 [Exophiala viscosa]
MPLTDLSIAEAKQVFDLNFWAILRMSQIFFPLLQQAARMNGCALLVNQTSVSSIGGAPFFSAYNTSKAAAAMLVHDLRLELAPFGIEVIELKTGAVKTNIHENDPVCQLPPGSPYTPIHEEIAKFSKGDDMIMNAQDPMIWAGNVVTDLNKPTPPNIIWRGTYASRVRLASILPVSVFDSTFRRVSKLDVLEQKLEATHANGTQA